MRTNKEIKAGDLRERVSFFNSSQNADGYGGFYSSPNLSFTCWAKVTNLSGARQNSEDQMVIKNQWEVIIRFNPLIEITKSMFLLYGGQTLIIDSIIDSFEYNRMIKIIAKARE